MHFAGDSGLSYTLSDCRWSIERTLRDHAFRVDAERLKQVSNILYETLPKIDSTLQLDELRGIEGKAAEQYFSVFNEMILNQKDAFTFTTRNRRPPLDNINAILSFAYTILAGDCANALKAIQASHLFSFGYVLLIKNVRAREWRFRCWY